MDNIMEDIICTFKTIQWKSEAEIESFIEELIAQSGESAYLEFKLKLYLEKVGIHINESAQKFIKIIFLSCILGSSSSQATTFLPSAGVEKIKSICKKRNLNYDQLVNLSHHEDGLLNIISSFLSNKKE